MTSNVLIYTKDYCSYSKRAKELLREKGVSFKEVDITYDADLQAHVRDISGRHTVPQIFIGDLHVGGHDDMAALDAAGELDGLLAGRHVNLAA